MFAIVEIAGSQYRVQENDVISVPSLGGDEGQEVSFTNILATGDGENAAIGTPYLDGTVTAKILGHAKGEKIIVFKKKRRKGYRKKNGHRQGYTDIQITGISVA